ncbi:ribbon-helix-helix protein, CopG family [Azotobacter vinelandii]|uniref:ribbon-helix-helix protein, CopG family n=1 Tax=Azotobacter vinelandii TaxID=354 RepID=UPI000AF838A6|nr:ribbon-helix-helix protein, CopG family [Azotobacter vinelandii]WKN23152.1 ribbon-helix-helix protein, CopG family [Azotobacter vinelandii]
MSTPYSRLNVRLPKSLLEGFKAAAAGRQDNTSSLIRAFMQDYVAQWELEVNGRQSSEQLARRVALLEETLAKHGVDIPKE